MFINIVIDDVFNGSNIEAKLGLELFPSLLSNIEVLLNYKSIKELL